MDVPRGMICKMTAWFDMAAREHDLRRRVRYKQLAFAPRGPAQAKPSNQNGVSQST